MRLKIVAAALACLCFLCPVVASAGPVREWIKENRPGILIPKRTGGCSSGQRCGGNQPAPAPTPDPELGISPSPNGTYILIQTSGGYVLRPSFSVPGQAGGNCGSGGTYYALPPSCVNGRCPTPR